MLDTQCLSFPSSSISAFDRPLPTSVRMPPEIGVFISKVMYENQLKSSERHLIQDHECLKFIDVRIGREEMQGSSWIVRLSH
jgi:hypothetical protein